MKLLFCDGETLEVRDVGHVIFRLKKRGVPLKPAGGYQILEDGEARAKLRELIDSELYEGGKV